ncbi:hypothetical protein AC1031_012232 [Aphanomyces cochlioides]|nr:hypothetical protein AC1031_012232 [Aphanomyces cochlioides]
MQFLSYHFGHRRGKPCKTVLLLWDDFSAHFTSEICQPADVSWVKPMKTQMRCRWVEYLRSEMMKHKGGAFKLSPPDRFDLVDWVNAAWDSVSRSTIINGFVKCKIGKASLPQDGPETATSKVNDEVGSQVLETLAGFNAIEVLELNEDLYVEDD